MSRKVIELVQVLIDRIHQGGYTQRALEDDIYAESQKRIAAEKDRDHWKQARQDAHEAGELMRAEIETLRKQLADAQRAVSDAFAEVNSVREQLDAARAETVETRKRLNEETDRHRATHAERIELFQQKEWANDYNAELRGKLDAANAAVTLQRAGIERLQAFVGKVRAARDEHNGLARDAIVEAALTELDAGAEPTPVAEPLEHAEGGA